MTEVWNCVTGVTELHKWHRVDSVTLWSTYCVNSWHHKLEVFITSALHGTNLADQQSDWKNFI